jgi:Zn-dependent protease with chaperone function
MSLHNYSSLKDSLKNQLEWLEMAPVPMTKRTRLPTLFYPKWFVQGISFMVLESNTIGSAMLDDSHPLTKTVKKIASDLVQSIDQVTGNKEHLEEKMKFIVISSPQRNAFALPSGHIVVYTGLFNVIDSDHELAGILAHELGTSSVDTVWRV